MIKTLNPTVQSKLHSVWLDLQFASSNTLEEPVHYYPTGLAFNHDTSWTELDKLLAVLRDVGSIKVLDKITDGGRHNLTTGYVIKIIQPTFSELETELPDLSLERFDVTEDKQILGFIPEDKRHKTLRKMAVILVSNERTDNYLLAKCIDTELTKKVYGNGEKYKPLIKNRFKTLNAYLKKKGFFASIEGKYSKISTYPIK